MSLSRLALVGAIVLSALAPACALSASTEETASSEEALSETFRLYEEPNLETNPACDIHTVLTLSASKPGDVKEPFPAGTVLYAHLREEVTGDCKRLIAPSPRAYRMLLDGTSCGSTIYRASETTDGVAREITLTDHRDRLCKDLVPARIVVEEATPKGDVRTLYASAVSLPIS